MPFLIMETLLLGIFILQVFGENMGICPILVLLQESLVMSILLNGQIRATPLGSRMPLVICSGTLQKLIMHG